MPPTHKKLALLTIAKYPLWATPFGFLSMVFFRFPLWLNSRPTFWRLMGCGKNGTFDIVPDLTQWAILTIVDIDNTDNPQTLTEQHLQRYYFGTFILNWFKVFKTTTTTFLLDPIEGHGLWNGKKVFGELAKQTDYDGEIAILTRATIRLNKLSGFWKNVNAVAVQMAGAPGFISSYGIGEIPFIKQATFSIWQSKTHMKQFAYGMQQHKDVIKKTHRENWYSEEMFVRFKILARFCQEV